MESMDGLMTQIFGVDEIQCSFCGMVSDNPEEEGSELLGSEKLVQEFFSSLTDDNALHSAVRQFCNRVYSQPNHMRSEVLLKLLEKLVQLKAIPARLVCDSLVNHPRLTYTETKKWCMVFKLIKTTISHVPYKGCRDLLKSVLERCHSLPDEGGPALIEALHSVCALVKYILNRETNLLPAYFSINEVMKFISSDDKPPVHWALGETLSSFIQSCRPAAQIVTLADQALLYPIVGHSNSIVHAWQLDRKTLKFASNGPLPYDREKKPALNLVRYILSQCGCTDFFTGILGFNNNKQPISKPCTEVGEYIADYIVYVLNLYQTGGIGQIDLRLRLGNTIALAMFYTLCQFINFPHLIYKLSSELEKVSLTNGKEHLMWFFLQFVPNIMNKNPVGEFSMIVYKVFDQLFCDNTVFPVPPYEDPEFAIAFAPLCTWMHLQHSAQIKTETRTGPPKSIPNRFTKQVLFLREKEKDIKNTPLSVLVVICNAHNKPDPVFVSAMSSLQERIMGDSLRTALLPSGVKCLMPTQALPIAILDSLSNHVKISLASHICHMLKVSGSFHSLQNNTGPSPSLALLETYPRLLIYSELEHHFGIKSFSQLLPNIQTMPMIHALVDMATYRLSQVQSHYRMGILGVLLNRMSSVNHNQLMLRYENSSLKLIQSLGNLDVQHQVYRSVNQSKFTLVAPDSEELVRILVLTLARAIKATEVSNQSPSSWYRHAIAKVMEVFPHNWSAYTLEFFPVSLSDHFKQIPARADHNPLDMEAIEEGWTVWRSGAVSSVIQHFTSVERKPYFLCVVWKALLVGGNVLACTQKVMEDIGAKAHSSLLRALADFFNSETWKFADLTCSSNPNSQAFNQCIDAIVQMSFKYNLFPLDRFIFFLSLRYLDGGKPIVCMLAIQNLICRSPLSAMVEHFASKNSKDPWFAPDWYEKHTTFHEKYPEKLFCEGVLEASGLPAGTSQTYLPIYYDNLCLRFLPVLDVLLHRMVETLSLPNCSAIYITQTLKVMGRMYKFHDRPVTYLYNTLHYYHSILRRHPAVRKALVKSILGCQENIIPEWVLSEEFRAFLSDEGHLNWKPGNSYYADRLQRLVKVITDDRCSLFHGVDWRVTEYSNGPNHVLYTTCVELLTLPLNGHEVGSALVNVTLKRCQTMSRTELVPWMNALALILTALPESYNQIVQQKLEMVLEANQELESSLPIYNPFDVFNLSKSIMMGRLQPSTFILVLCQAVWFHSGIEQLGVIPKFVREKLKQHVKTERQFFYICHLLGPFLLRFYQEKTKCCIDLTIEFYEILAQVDSLCTTLHHVDTISDFFYHIKYMFIGNEVKQQIIKVISTLRQSLRWGLRFIAQEETTASGERP